MRSASSHRLGGRPEQDLVHVHILRRDLQEEEEGREVGKFDLEGGAGPFKLYFHDKPCLVPAPFQGFPLLQLEFTVQAPWVLEDSEPA